jgi:hypothetical protein
MKENLLLDPWFESSFNYGTNTVGFLSYPPPLNKEIDPTSETMVLINSHDR